MSDRPDLRERVARAQHSSDLRHKEKPCDVDTLAAVGMVSVGRPIVSLLYALKYDNDHTAYWPALEQLDRIVRGMDRRKRWKASDADLEWIARIALDYWTNPKCKTCTGIGFLKAKGAPTLQAKPCPACGSSGYAKVVLPKQFKPDPWDRRLSDILNWLEYQDSMGAGETKAKLRGDGGKR